VELYVEAMGERLIGRRKHRRQDNIKMGAELKRNSMELMDCKDLSLNTVLW
jgi:hypothetical protein